MSAFLRCWTWSTALIIWTLVGCEWSEGLPSDPASWSPPPSGQLHVDADDSESSNIDPACTTSTPAIDPALRTSSATAVSHLPGVTCLAGCHVEGGEAHTAFAAGGTAYRSQISRAFAEAGNAIHGVGGTTLIVDRCGNFYAVVGSLETDIALTQPFVENPTLHKMEKPLRNEKVPGDCSQPGCHDFAERSRWGVYY